MPINRTKKCTTPTPLGSMQEQTIPALPDQQTFQQHRICANWPVVPFESSEKR